MAHLVLIISSLLLLASTQSTDAVVQQVINNAAKTPGGHRFETEVGIEYGRQILIWATTFIWEIFQQHNPVDRKNVQQVTLVVEQMEGVAYTANNQIHLSAKYVHQYSGDVKREAPGGLIDGIADYVRLKAGYAPAHSVKPGQGERWDQGYDVTARFLEYCNSLRNGFVAELNKKMRTGYSNSYFNELLGKSVDQLWGEYKAKYSH
ncbi:hypothetical protein Ancab_028374 [Ancistrocladus abbreviatus]